MATRNQPKPKSCIVQNEWAPRAKWRPKRPRAALTHARLLEILSYDKEGGVFRWRIKVARRVRVGDTAGSQHKNGYVYISIGHRLYAAHRLAWCESGEKTS